VPLGVLGRNYAQPLQKSAVMRPSSARSWHPDSLPVGHLISIAHWVPFDENDLGEGQKVSYDLETGRDGKVSATNLQLL